MKNTPRESPSSTVAGAALEGPSKPLHQLLHLAEEYNLVLLFVLLFATLSFLVDHFFSIDNMLGLALSVSQIGMVACTMMFCLASRDFDLSIGSTVAFSGVLCAMVLNTTDSIFIGVGISLLAGALIGFVNGAIIAYLRINALITDIQRNGNEGIGKPEPLKHGFQGYWSRRITDEHRLVYKVIDDEIRIAACRYHYER